MSHLLPIDSIDYPSAVPKTSSRVSDCLVQENDYPAFIRA